MQDRYALRFESGERKGEVVPVPAGRFTVGRRPGNSLQIPDASVSGQHAELVADESEGVLVRDLGSTNGTSVGGRRVEEARAAHGDRVAFGSVQLTVLDRELADDAPAAVPARGSAAPAEAVGTVRADQLAKAGRRSRAPLLFLVAGLLVAGGAAYTFLGRGGSGGGRLRAVLDPPGNLVTDGYSFEAETLAWTSEERAPQSFFQSAAARVSGATGVRAELAPSEWAVLGSPEVPAREGQTLALEGELRATGGAGARLGVEFLRAASGSGPAPGPVHAWSAWVSGSDEFQRVELAAPVPPGTQRARVVIEARTGDTLEGTADADDVAVVAESGAAVPAGERDAYQLFFLGDPPQEVAIYKLGRPLIGDMGVEPASPPSGAPRSVTLSGVREERRSLFSFEGVDGPALLTLRVEPATLAGGIATMGPGGYREHGPDFEREEATGILFGKGLDVAALRFEEPVSMRATAEGDGVRLRIELGPLPRFIGQLDFREERARAGDLAYAARNAERDGDLGKALESWRELLEEYPFEKELVSEAEAARGRLIQRGLEELRALREGVERAQFFRIAEHFRELRDATRDVARRYAESEVAQAAGELEAEIAAALEVLEADQDRDELQRLGAIQAVLERSESPGLAQEVRDYLEGFGGTGR